MGVLRAWDALIQSPPVASSTTIADLPSDFRREVMFVFVILALWCVIQLVTYAVDWALSIRSLSLAERMSISFRVRGYNHLLRLPLSFHKEQRFGSVMENMNMGAFTMQSVTQDILQIAPKLLTLVAAFSFAFFINVWLALILVVSVAMYVVVARSTLAPLAPLERSYHQYQREAHGTVYNVISQVREVKIAAYENREGNTIAHNFTGPLLGTFLHIRGIWERMSFFQRVLVLITQIAIYVLGIIFVTQGVISVGELVAFNAYAGLLYGPFIEFNDMWQWLQNYVTNLLEAEKIFEEPQEIYHPEGAGTPTLRGEIVFDHASFAYDTENEVLTDVSFTIPAGTRTALVGRSGEGKSTIIDLVAGFYFPTSGSVAIDGIDTRSIDLENVRRQIGVVSQEIALFNSVQCTTISRMALRT
ncbi:MAG: ABC transporter ATP-binding protein [Candidatus Campbellbacteria bacterium]|nr:ABC transporter ATP-binding protein [Candidatus Campbellbacteria bacterium]